MMQDFFTSLLREFGPNIAMGAILIWWMNGQLNGMQKRLDNKDNQFIELIKNDTSASVNQATAMVSLTDTLKDVKRTCDALEKDFKVIKEIWRK